MQRGCGIMERKFRCKNCKRPYSQQWTLENHEKNCEIVEPLKVKKKKFYYLIYIFGLILLLPLVAGWQNTTFNNSLGSEYLTFNEISGLVAWYRLDDNNTLDSSAFGN